jgi:hypothetical protein
MARRGGDARATSGQGDAQALFTQELTATDLGPGGLHALLGAADPIGVLSVFVDDRATAIDIQNRLAQVERAAIDEGRAERAAALSEALVRVAPALERLRAARARAVFTPLSRITPTVFSTQLRLPNRVVLDDRPFVHPLLESLDRGRPAGVILMAPGSAEVLEWRHGELIILARIDAESDLLADRQRPAAGHRARDRHRRFADQVAAEVLAHADLRNWERAVVGGDDRLTQPLIRVLPAPLRDHTIRDRRQLMDRDSRALAEIVQELLERHQAEWDLALATRVREAALAGGAAALGVSEVLAALNDARVMHLVYDPEIRYGGFVAEGGQLLSAGEQRSVPERVFTEPRMTERMVERCLETGARITPVTGAASALLTDAGGVAARLRW